MGVGSCCVVTAGKPIRPLFLTYNQKPHSAKLIATAMLVRSAMTRELYSMAAVQCSLLPTHCL